MANYSPMGKGHPLVDVAGQAPISVTVTSSSTQLLAANENRRYVVFSNVGNIDAFIAVGKTAVNLQGIALLKGEQIILGKDSESPKEVINGIAAANTAIAIQEFQ